MKRPTLETWQDRVRAIEKYHYQCLEEAIRRKENWRLEDTAKELNRSKGRISEDLTIAEWMSIDPKVERCYTATEALEYIKKIKRNKFLSRFDSLEK